MRTSFAQVLRSAANVAGMNAAALVLGFTKDLIVAARFGVQDSTDAYFGATAMPRLLNALTLTLIGLVVVTIFIEVRERRGEAAAWRYAERVLGASTLFALALAALTAVFAAPLVHLTLPGLGDASAGGTAELLALLAPSVAFVGLTAVLGGLLNANRVFALPAALGVIVNVGVIGAIALGAERLGIAALAIGTDLGYAACAAVELAVLIHLGLRPRPVLGFRDPDVRRTLTLAAPLVGAVASEQVGLVAARLFVSFGSPGSLSLYVFIEKLRNAPVTLIGQALGIALYPSLAQAASSGANHAIRAGVGRGVRVALALAVPIGGVFAICGGPVVRLVYQRGSFTSGDSEAGGVLLAAFAAGLVALTVVEVLDRAFYALQRTGWPAIGSLVRAVIIVIVALALLPSYGALGVAVAFSAAAMAELAALGLLLARDLEARIVPDALRTTLAIAACAAAIWVAARALGLEGDGIVLGVGLLFIAIAGFIGYLAAVIVSGTRSVRAELHRLMGAADGSESVDSVRRRAP